jgi:hypothetical protein
MTTTEEETIRIRYLIKHETLDQIKHNATVEKCYCTSCFNQRDADNRFRTFHTQSSIYNMGETE